VRKLGLNPNKEMPSAKEATKKLKYLKTAKKPRFILMLNQSQKSRTFLLLASLIFIPE
jgi:hypothetical protein